MSIRIGINGLGRIGRCVLRAISELGYDDLEVVAVNGPAEMDTHLHLLQYDSVHGRFPHEVKAEGNRIIMGNQKPQLLQARDIADLPWGKLGVDIVLECTGKFNSRDQAAAHLAQGAKKVLVSAPCKEADATIVVGVNHDVLNASHDVVSVGSCTTNCLAPVAKVLHDAFTIEHGFMTTIHAYTNDQRVLDGSHKDLRRARACATSMIPTTTGAAKALGLVIPELAGKLDGAAVRVPTPNVSMVDLKVILGKDVTKEGLIETFKNAAKAMSPVLEVTDRPLVSIDFNHVAASSTIDLHETHVLGNRFARVVAWYDNEWGFSARMLDLTRLIAKEL